jgi:hypothetical protein
MNFTWRNLLSILITSSSLSPNISLRAQALMYVHATANTIVPGLLGILLHNREYWEEGMDTTR